MLQQQQGQHSLIGSRQPTISVSRKKIPTDPRYFDPKSPLSRLLDCAPYLPRCSNTKIAILVKPKIYAIEYAYMQVNRSDMISWLVFDLDHENSFIWQDENLPPPNMIVRNRDDGKAHLYYAIEPVCVSVKGREAPQLYLKDIRRAYAKRLGADLDYVGPVAKTPGHPFYLTTEIHNEVYDLGTLVDSVDTETLHSERRLETLLDESDSRHLQLFHTVRFFAYSIVAQERTRGSQANFYERVNEFAEGKNAFKNEGYRANLTLNQVQYVVKSITGWTWAKYRQNYRNRKRVMDFPHSLSTLEKQILSAKRTHELRNEETSTAIHAACKSLLRAKKTLSLASIARLAGRTRQTTAKYKHVISSFTLPPKKNVSYLLNQKVKADCGKSVNYGLHIRVTAAIAFLLACRSFNITLTLDQLMCLKLFIYSSADPPS